MYRLYDLELSGNAYKVRLLLNLLALPHERIPVDVSTGAHKQPAYLALNPKGQVPTLVDGDTVVTDSQAILVYLATKEGADQFYPSEPYTRARIQTWLSTAANEIARGPADARLVTLFGAGLDYDQAIATSNRMLPLLEQTLEAGAWLVGPHVTIADIAVFPYVALAGDAAIDLTPYPAIRAWIDRVRALPGFVGMSGIDVLATA